jgi:hypothetical protein
MCSRTWQIEGVSGAREPKRPKRPHAPCLQDGKARAWHNSSWQCLHRFITVMLTFLRLSYGVRSATNRIAKSGWDRQRIRLGMMPSWQ